MITEFLTKTNILGLSETKQMDDESFEEIFSKTITEELGRPALLLIQKEVGNNLHIPLVDAIKNFEIINKILEKNFGKGSLVIEKKFLFNLLNNKTARTRSEQKTVKSTPKFEVLMNCINDKDKISMISKTLKKSLITEDIIKGTGISQTTGYRKIRELIDQGILVVDGNHFNTTGKLVPKYTTPFKELIFNISGESKKIKLVPKEFKK